MLKHITWKEIETFVKKYQLEQCYVWHRIGSIEFQTPKKNGPIFGGTAPIAEIRTYTDKYICGGKYVREYWYKGQIVSKEIAE